MLNISPKSVSNKVKSYKLYSLNTLNTPRSGRVLAYWLMAIAAIFFFMLFLPWQQNIDGTGKVTALDPRDRPQTVQTAIAGRIEDWKVQEGDFVNKGDTILTLTEIKDDYFDPELLTRLGEQQNAKETSIGATEQQAAAVSRQIGALKSGLQFSLNKARNKYKQTSLKNVSDSTDYEAEKINYQIAKAQFERYERLHAKDGLISLTDLERRRLKLQESSAKLMSVKNKYLVSQNEMTNALIELNSLQAEYTDKISKAESELNAKLAYIADAKGELSKVKNKIVNVKVRTEQHALIAPQDGHIVKALKAGIGETIKEGEAVVTVMPDIPMKAVELYIRPMDVPLLSKGRKVRLQFDGWPALQFSGWPSVAVGTFGGVVQVIDYVNSADGNYRILVKPDPNDDPWPMQLRVGSGVFGWAMLDEVPIWYEIWRQLNGFPPSLKAEPAKDDAKGAKK
ncbi:HlyD family secretion protein [Flexibacter flexilis]|nr:HlyD family efflux transporter periplasmic adaptor subunit [Flexibacter flexilis]